VEIKKYRPLSGNASPVKRRHYLLIILCFFEFTLFCLSPVFSSSTISSRFYSLRKQCLSEIKKSQTNIRLSRNHVGNLSGKCTRFQKRYPASTYAPRVLYLAGRMWEELYYTSDRFSDLNQALKFYGKITVLYTFSNLSDDALFRRGILYLKIGLKKLALSEFTKLKKRYPRSNLIKLTILHIKLLSYSKTSLKTPGTISYFKGFRYWANNHYARVVMDFSSKPAYRTKVLNQGARTKVELFFNRLKTKKGTSVTYGKSDEFLDRARLLKRSNKLTIVIFFRTKGRIKVFSLFSPFRIVIDALASAQENHTATPRVAQKRGFRNFTVCLDPGHGGKDPGAIGPRGIREKDVVLRIARIIKKKLINNYGYKVIMTRNRDVFVPLEQRVAFANSRGADLFVSIHINASRNRRLQGITTFCLSNTSDRKSLRLAARENGITMAQMSQTDKILSDMLFSEKYNESFKVAHVIQPNVIHQARSYWSRIRDLGVRFAPFYVLAGAKMPAVLMELDFISNPHGEKRLLKNAYLNKISEGIAKGIKKTTKTIHIASVNPN